MDRRIPVVVSEVYVMIMLSIFKKRKAMATYDERLVSLEESTVTLRSDLSQAIKRINQLEEYRDDNNHQQTILLGIAYGQEKSIKSIQRDMSTLKGDVQDIKGHLAQHTTLLTQILARLPEKF